MATTDASELLALYRDLIGRGEYSAMLAMRERQSNAPEPQRVTLFDTEARVWAEAAALLKTFVTDDDEDAA